MTHRFLAAGLGLLLLLLAACGDNAAVGWRDLSLTMPDGWRVAEQSNGVLTITNGQIAPSPGTAGANDVLAQFLVVSGAGPQPWRDLVLSEGGTLEEDEPLQLDGAAGTRLTWRWVTNGIPTREMIVVIPSRNLEILFQPVALAGQSDAPDVFVAHRDEFEAIIASMSFGAPVS